MSTKSLLPHAFLCTLALAGTMATSHATLLVHEGFDYSGTNNSTMNGVASTGTGVQGTWTVTNAQPTGGTASSLYQTTGLSFGSNYGTTNGGALRQNTTFSGSNAATFATVQLDSSAATTGELWGSYLVNYNSVSLANGGFGMEGISTNASGTATYFSSMMQSDTPATSRRLQVAYDTTPTTSASTTAFATNTTYLYISKYTNVGTALSGATTGVATTWVMNQAQYDTWISLGATEATLTANSLVTRTETVNSGQFNFDSSGYLTLKTDAPNFNSLVYNATYDEIQYGTTLGDVYQAVPEPSAIALFAGAGFGILLFRRKRFV